jgi:hypothetical protein
MAKSGKKDKKEAADGTVNVCRNRRALHDYEILDRIECGIVLVGTEVKSLRDGHANLEDAYGRVDGGEVWLIGAEIPEYLFGNRLNHKPRADAGAVADVLQRGSGESGAGPRQGQAGPRQAPVAQVGRRQARDGPRDGDTPKKVSSGEQLRLGSGQ